MSLLLLFAPATLANVSISQVGDSITATGGTQVVQTNGTVAQAHATLTASTVGIEFVWGGGNIRH